MQAQYHKDNIKRLLSNEGVAYDKNGNPFNIKVVGSVVAVESIKDDASICISISTHSLIEKRGRERDLTILSSIIKYNMLNNETETRNNLKNRILKEVRLIVKRFKSGKILKRCRINNNRFLIPELGGETIAIDSLTGNLLSLSGEKFRKVNLDRIDSILDLNFLMEAIISIRISPIP